MQMCSVKTTDAEYSYHTSQELLLHIVVAMSVLRSAKVVIKGQGKEVSLTACDLVTKGCQTLDQILCSDGSKCFKIGGTPGCGMQSITVPKGVIVYVYSAMPLASWNDLCGHSPLHTLTGPVTSAVGGTACAIKAILNPGETCESSIVSNFISKLGINGPHGTIIIAVVVVVVAAALMFGIHGKKKT